MGEVILQRVVMPPRPGLRRLYYRCHGRAGRAAAVADQHGRRAILLQRGTILRTDTWFNAFFEHPWRQHVKLQRLVLRMVIRGAGTLRLYRRSAETGQKLLQEMHFAAHDGERTLDVPQPRTQAGDGGLLFFEMRARSARLWMRQAEWLATEVAPRPTRLVAAFCTFNRASWLVRNLQTLLNDVDAASVLERIIVVDQGTERLRDHPAFAVLERAAGKKLRLLEQANFGGSGGFTRCLLEAQGTESATDVLLMDDDVVLEPESVLRAAAFLSLARNDVAVGGHVLDADHPQEVIEPGSRYLPRQLRVNEPQRFRVDRPAGLRPFLVPPPRHYNGWWFLAIPLSVLERTGLPLPLFLRGDDVEFGCRLLRHGIPTVTLPGVAVWHEPFERKTRGWHSYYELRNYLVVGALYSPEVRASTICRRFFSRLVDELLAYDYYDGWLLCAAVADFLRGPNLLRQPPLPNHRLLAAHKQRTPALQPRSNAALPLCSQRRPRGRFRIGLLRLRHLLRNLLKPSPAADAPPQRWFEGSGEQWYNTCDADVIAVEEPYRDTVVILRRSRSQFLHLLLRGLWLATRLLCGHRWTARRWRNESHRLMTRQFWLDYLAFSRAEGTSSDEAAGSQAAVRVEESGLESVSSR